MPIRAAATLVLARESPNPTAGEGVEVFLSRRTSKAAFMANAYVYPGGRVDPADASEGITPRLLPTDSDWFAAQFEDEISSADARAIFVAALRESFEEAGVLFARDQAGRPLSLADPEAKSRLATWRERLNRGAASFEEILVAEALTLDASGLDYFAHWITPPFESRRFDTRFFFAGVPNGQEPVPDYAELVHGDWFSPRAAIAAYARGEIDLAPPTLCTLDDMGSPRSLAEAQAWASRQVPVPILPRLTECDGRMSLLLPGDAEYPSDTPVAGPTRVVHRDGRFHRE